jgi:hypothetical protein
MPVFGLVFVAQILFCVHAVRTGRPYFWIFLIVFLPLIGMAVYFFAEMLPELMGNPRTRIAASQMAKTLDPGRGLRDAERRLAMTPTTENKAALAEAYLNDGRTEEALDLFRAALTGIHATDPGMMLGLARTHYERGEFPDTQMVLEELRRANPDYASSAGHLLYARSLEAQGKVDAALFEYEALAPVYPGQEARYRYASLLRQAGQEANAHLIFQEICQAGEFAPRHIRRTQGEWYAQARRQLAQ